MTLFVFSIDLPFLKLCKILLLFWLFAGFLIVPLSRPAGAQEYPQPEISDSVVRGRMLSRAMNLLASGTPEKQNTVRILVYGQSISEQDWWLEVKNDLEERFPHANIIMENRAIGGFASQLLYKTVRMDVESFYPDLVLFHVYGDHRYYDTIIRHIKSHTAAEVGIQTDHYTGDNWWSDQMSYEYLPSYAEKYGCELINIRDPWKAYLDVNTLQPSDLLRDGVHLNEHGNYLMAELIKPWLVYDPDFPRDTFGVVTVYRLGEDVDFAGDTLVLPFSGNRVDLLLTGSGYDAGDSVYVFLDGHKPSRYQGTAYMSRPYNDANDYWPWNLGSMVRVGHDTPWLEEEWTLTYTSMADSMKDFDFEVSGSLTGYDGAGTKSEDFISDSRRGIIEGGAVTEGDWHVQRSFDVTDTETHEGDQVKWQIYKIATDAFLPGDISGDATEHRFTLFQGIPNTCHTLTLVKKGKVPFDSIRVYRPYWDRETAFRMRTDTDSIFFSHRKETKMFRIVSNTFWEIENQADWLRVDTVSSSGNACIMVTARDNYVDDVRRFFMVVRGTGVPADTILVHQEAGFPVGIREDQEDGGLRVFPNPANQKIRVFCPGHSNGRLRIFDLQGRLCTEKMPVDSGPATVDISAFPPGLYIIEIRNSQSVSKSRFVIR